MLHVLLNEASHGIELLDDAKGILRQGFYFFGFLHAESFSAGDGNNLIELLDFYFQDLFRCGTVAEELC